MSRGDHQVYPADESLLVNFVVVEKCPPRRLSSPNAFETIGAGESTHVLAKDFRIIQQLLQALNTVQHLNEPRVMVVKRTQHGGTLQFVKLGQFLIGA